MKKIVKLSLFASISLLAGDDIEGLKAQIEALKAKVEAIETKQQDSNSDVATLKKTLSEVKAHDANDNIKWGIDLRTSYDVLNYKDAKGNKLTDSILSNRLWLDMKYAPTNKLSFIGQLSYNKAMGANPPSSSTGMPQRGFGYDTFDWVVNENLTDSTLKVKQAYWIYFGEMGDVPYSASVGRRPSVNGFPANLRDDDPMASPLAHNINVEFDGASFKFDLDKVTGVPGMWAKLCLGRGLTNAKSRFDMAGLDYSKESGSLESINMLGLIFIPYDDGQYSLWTKFYRGTNVPGFDMYRADGTGMIKTGTMMGNMFVPTAMNTNPTMYSLGNMDGATATFIANGLSSDSDSFLGKSVFFASYGMSKTDPDSGKTMLGSSERKTGHSIWVGAQMPAMVTEGKFGLEYNHGSKYWRPFTYGEDTLIGSKAAVRGNAYEAYYTHPITKALSAQIRYTYLDYKYTGSQSFFGAEGTPMSIDEAQKNATMMQSMGLSYPNPVDSASDLRMYVRYKY